MAVDTRYKRASAMQVVAPYQWTTHSDTTSAVDDEERWGAGWIYIGITISGAAAGVFTFYYYQVLLAGGED